MANAQPTPSAAQLQRRKDLRANYTRMMFSDDTRGRLLRASAVAVSRFGTRACTVQHILDEADLSRRTFYKTFSGLEDALNSLYEVSVNVLKRTMNAAVGRARTPLGKVIAAFDTYLQMQIIGGPLIIALQREATRDDSPLAIHRNALIDELLALMRREIVPVASQPVDDDISLSIICAAEGLVGRTDSERRFQDEDRIRIRRTLVSLLTRTYGLARAAPQHKAPTSA